MLEQCNEALQGVRESIVAFSVVAGIPGKSCRGGSESMRAHHLHCGWERSY